jgi:hypothetical protein
MWFATADVQGPVRIKIISYVHVRSGRVPAKFETMSDVANALAEAFAHRKSKEFGKALSIYGPLWEADPLAFGDWAGWSYAYCLKQTGKYLQALDVCRALYPRFGSFQLLAQLYAACVYHTQFGGKEAPPLPVAKKAVEAMLRLHPPHEPYSLTGKALFKYVKMLLGQPRPGWDEAEALLLQLDPSLLDSATFRMEVPGGRSVEFASPLEEWYSLMIKVKAGKEEPQALLDLLGSARKLQLKWHYNNNIWFARKEAFAYRQLGDNARAESILRELTRKKNDWFLLSDLADTVSEKTEALRLCCRAALAHGDLPKKVRLFHKMYRLIRESGDAAVARKHLLLEAALRRAEGWPEGPDLEKALMDEAVTDAGLFSVNPLLKELTVYWRKASGQDEGLCEGEIDQLLDSGFAGFVKDKSGDRYYFNMRDARALGNNCVKGTRVVFELREGFDKKKNKPARNAVNLQPKRS